MIFRVTCQRVASALKITSRVAAKPESAGSGNVNINIKTSNGSLAITPEDVTLRVLKPSDSKTGQPETLSTGSLLPRANTFSTDQFQL
jgi:archaellin